MQWLAREREVRFAECLVLRRVGVDEWCDVFRKCFPVVDELRFADLFSDARTDHVQPDNRPVLLADQLDEPGGAEDLGLAVATEVVLVDGDVVSAECFDRLGL